MEGRQMTLEPVGMNGENRLERRIEGQQGVKTSGEDKGVKSQYVILGSINSYIVNTLCASLKLFLNSNNE